MYVSYAQLGAVHQAAGEIESRARQHGRKLPGGLFVGSVKSIDMERAPDGPGYDDVVVTFARHEAPTITRRYSYFGNAVRVVDEETVLVDLNDGPESLKEMFRF